MKAPVDNTLLNDKQETGKTSLNYEVVPDQRHIAPVRRMDAPPPPPAEDSLLKRFMPGKRAFWTGFWLIVIIATMMLVPAIIPAIVLPVLKWTMGAIAIGQTLVAKAAMAALLTAGYVSAIALVWNAGAIIGSAIGSLFKRFCAKDDAQTDLTAERRQTLDLPNNVTIPSSSVRPAVVERKDEQAPHQGKSLWARLCPKSAEPQDSPINSIS